MAMCARTLRSFQWKTGRILRSCLLARKQASISDSLWYWTTRSRGSAWSQPQATIPRSPSQRATSATFASLRRTFPSGKSRNRAAPRLLTEAGVSPLSSLARSFSIRRSRSRASLRARFGEWVTTSLRPPSSMHWQLPIDRAHSSRPHGP